MEQDRIRRRKFLALGTTAAAISALPIATGCGQRPDNSATGAGGAAPAAKPPAPAEPPRKWRHDYERQLTEKEIAAGKHRTFVGGGWDKVGKDQFEFMKEMGLKPEHKMLDVGCGSLRGGVHFVAYLDSGNYYGVDMNESLIRAGRDVELPKAGLQDREVHLLVNETFDFGRFGAKFPFALAMSVFTHIPMNAIQRCLVRIAEVMEPGGKFYATYFPAPKLHSLDPIQQEFKGKKQATTKSDDDPFHYHLSVFEFLTNDLPLKVRNVGEWSPDHLQQMLEFTRTPDEPVKAE